MNKLDMSLVITFQERVAHKRGTMHSIQIYSMCLIWIGVSSLVQSATMSVASSRRTHSIRLQTLTYLHGIKTTTTLLNLQQKGELITMHASRITATFYFTNEFSTVI